MSTLSQRYKELLSGDLWMALVYQAEKHGDEVGFQHHTPPEWTTILAEEFGEAAMEANKAWFDHTDRTEQYCHELLQVAAVAIAAVECARR